jgi:FKBP-type peptidyl-prolyl cis-trans isomerases 2
MSETISINKFVELTYRIIDQSNGEVIEQVEEPLGYVQGDNSLLFNQVTKELEGKCVGDEVEILLKAEDAFGKKADELIFTDDINNVPMEYRFIGASVTMQNDKGGTKDFIVSSIEDGKLTIDGNHPLAGKDIIFYVEILSIREATADEIIEGGKVRLKKIQLGF